MSRIYFNFLIILFFLTASANAQNFKSTKFEEGDLLLRKDFQAVTQDSSLILYFSNGKEILEFDGTEFYESKLNFDSIKSPLTHHLYLKGKHFLSYKNLGTYTYNQSNEELTKLSSVEVDGSYILENQLFFSNGNILYRFSENRLLPVFETDAAIVSLHQFPNNFVLGTKRGLKILDLDYNEQNSLGSFLTIEDAIKSSTDELLILDRGAIFKYDFNSLIRETEIKSRDATDFARSIEGDLWIGTSSNGLLIYNGLELKRYKDDFDSKINELKVDKEGFLWVLKEQGIEKIDFNGPLSYLINEGNLGGLSDQEEIILISSNKLKLYNKIDGWSEVTLPFKVKKFTGGFKSDGIWNLVMDNHNFKLNPEYNVTHEPINKEIYKIFKLNDSLVFIDYQSKAVIADNQFEEIDEIPVSAKIEAVSVDGQNLFLLTEDHRFLTYDIDSKKLLLLKQFQNNLKLSLIGNTTFGLNHDSLYVWRGNEEPLRYHKRVLGISDKRPLSISAIDSKSCWINTKNTIIKIQLNNDRTESSLLDVKRFSTKNMNINPIISKSININSQEGEDQDWLLTPDAIIMVNFLKVREELRAPGIKELHVKAYNLNLFGEEEDTTTLGENILLNNDHYIKINARIISNMISSDDLLAYRINGSDWSFQPQAEPILLINTSSGDNTLEVASVNEAGVFSKGNLKYSYGVKQPLWKQQWIYYSAAATIVFIGFIGYRSIKSSKENYSSELQEKLNKELQDLQKRSHEQILKAQRLKQLNDLIRSQKSELENKNKKIESQKYELKLTNDQIKTQKDLLEETSSKLKASINYAQRIQDALMSTEVEIKNAIDDSFVMFLPRDVVSGDFFWFKKFINEDGDEILIITAVDCTGHGVPGAIVSVVGMNLLNNITELKNIHDPGKILTELNKDIIENLRQSETQVNDGMDMSLITINKTKRKVFFGGAKNPVIYFEDGELMRIKGDKHAIGGQQRGIDRIYTTHEIDCSDGKERIFYLFSDGYPDQFGGEKGFKFLSKNFKTVLEDIHNKPVLEQKETLYNTIQDWKGDYPQTDDILVIGFRF